MNKVSGWRESAVNRLGQTIAIILFVVLMGSFRELFPERPADYVGPQAFLDAGFALVLLGLIMSLAGGLGLRAISLLNLNHLNVLERAVFGLPIGLGIIAYGVLLLGLVGLLQSWAILLWIVLLSVWTRREWFQIVTAIPASIYESVRRLKLLGVWHKAFLILASLIFLLSLVLALAPPWDYDGLMYHLQAPKLFIEAGRIMLLPDLWQANGPLTIEMLYAVGLAFGSDTFAKLMHLAYGTLVLLATFSFGRRFLGPSAGWVAMAIMLGVLAFPFWSSLTHIDNAWTLYEFLGLYAVCIWTESKRPKWLVSSGLAMGLAIGSKYMALGGAGILGMWVLWRSRAQGARAMIVHGAIYGCIALAIGSPWYIKNWLWAGNPFYPLIFGGAEWGLERVRLLETYLFSFGTGRRLIDFLLLPWNVYAQPSKFSTALAGIEIPSLLFPLALLYPVLRCQRVMNAVAWRAALGFMLWAIGSQQTRFMLPFFPALSLLAAQVLNHFCNQSVARWWRHFLLVGLPGGLVLVTLIVQIFLLNRISPYSVVVGIESKDTFLSRVVGDYRSLKYVQAHLTAEDRVLMLWDGQGYYCDRRCLPDPEQSRWTRLVHSTPHPSGLLSQLRGMKVTHLLLSRGDAEWLLTHDPTGQHHQAWEYFFEEIRNVCTKELYQDERVYLFELSCP